MSCNTTKETLGYIEEIKENKNYIQIGVEKYKKDFDNQIRIVNNILDLNIISTSLGEIEKKLENIRHIDFIEYMDVVSTIAIIGENLWSVVLEEKDPMIPKLNRIFEEEEEER